MCLRPSRPYSRHSNVVILTTSNVTEKIDLAFVDRADIKQYIGPPSVNGIYSIYLSCLEELMKVNVADLKNYKSKIPLHAHLWGWWSPLYGPSLPT